MAHYIDNKEFFKALVERRAIVDAAKEAGTEIPRVSEYLGSCILKIANYLYFKPNFIRMVLYKDEMILEAVEAGLKSIDKFDVTRGTSPFSYFTQVAYYAFIHAINKEKHQYDVKKKLILEMDEDAFDVQEQDEDGGFTNSYIKWVRDNAEPVKEPTAKPAPLKGLDLFMDDVDEQS